MMNKISNTTSKANLPPTKKALFKGPQIVDKRGSE
jgi:hypothetical protein